MRIWTLQLVRLFYFNIPFFSRDVHLPLPLNEDRPSPGTTALIHVPTFHIGLQSPIEHIQFIRYL
jgi:hypothetical protein